MPSPLPASFYRRQTATVARELIGCVLCTPTHRVRLLETEAYLPENDAACHASRGATPRNLPMFEPGGILYVYFIYGMHWCSNIVTEERGKGAAVLLRGGDVVSGPGRLSKYLGFDGSFSGMSVLRGSAITVREDNETDVYRQEILSTPRIGISVATHLPLRFVHASQVRGGSATSRSRSQTPGR